MKRANKISRLEEKLAAFVAARQNKTVEEVKESVPDTDASKVHSEETLTLEADSALLYFNLKGKGFINQECKSCGRIFAYKYTTFGRVSLCSMECRKIELLKLGIKWNPYKLPEERWEPTKTHGPLPAIVPPEALERLDEILRNSESPPDAESEVLSGTSSDT